MNLKKKKQLASKTLGVGKERIVFLPSRLAEIKEAITKQDIRDLYANGAMLIKEVRGRRKAKPDPRKRGSGKVGIKVNSRKSDYVILTRKLRAYIRSVSHGDGLSKEQVKSLRSKIRNKVFRSKAHLKEFLKQK